MPRKKGPPILVEAAKCAGCLICQLRCSLRFERAFVPALAAIIPGAAKLLITTKFPINGAFGTAAAGGSFPLWLKTLCYDHVVIAGRSPRPVYLRLAQDEVELCDAAERAWNMDKLLNTRIGFSRKDDRPPEKWFQPLKTEDGDRLMRDYFNTTDIAREDMERFLDDYYDERGYDKATGTPGPDKVRELGLE